MGKIVSARIDEKTKKELSRLSKALGKPESEIIRDGIHLMVVANIPPSEKKNFFIGCGQFDSGVSDLASNKKHLDGYGK